MKIGARKGVKGTVPEGAFDNSDLIHFTSICLNLSSYAFTSALKATTSSLRTRGLASPVTTAKVKPKFKSIIVRCSEFCAWPDLLMKVPRAYTAAARTSGTGSERRAQSWT